MYVKHCKLTNYQQLRLMEYFVAGTPARTAADLVGIHRKGKRGRGAAGKVIVFGLLKRGGKVYTMSVADVKGKTLLPVIRRRVKPDSVVYTDFWHGHNALDVSEFKHYRINHYKEFACNHNHINRIENFYPKRA